MTITEFAKELKKLSNNYDLTIRLDSYRDTSVLYKNKKVLIIGESQFNVYGVISHDEFEKLPFSHKLWMLASELAMIPCDERFKQNKYNVIIGKDRGMDPYVVWSSDGRENYSIVCTTFKFLQTYDCFKFTDSEFKGLISYIKTLPDSEFQVKVAEHGKQLIRG